jgi:hypothetical protein
MKKFIYIATGTAILMTTLLTSCTKKDKCVCTIDGERFEYDMSGQNGATKKTTCEAMKYSMNLSGTGSCKLE